jgi:hypothetical protein
MKGTGIVWRDFRGDQNKTQAFFSEKLYKTFPFSLFLEGHYHKSSLKLILAA